MSARFGMQTGALFGAISGGFILGAAYPPSPAPYLALVAWVPLLLGWGRAASARDAWMLGVGFYAACFAVAFNWPLRHAYPNVSVASFLPLVALVLLLAAPLGLSRLAVRDGNRTLGGLAFVAFHLLVEALLARGPFALPWPLAGNALASAEAVWGLAALGSVPLLSAWVLAVNVALYRMAVTEGPKRAPLLVTAVIVLLGVGAARIASPEVQGVGERKVALVQPALPATVWADLESRSRVASLIAMTDSLYRQTAVPPDLTVWPETALPPCPGEAVCADVRERLIHLVEGPLPPILTGAVTTASQGGELAWNNSSLLLSGDSIAARYDKVRLVPFAEAVPFVTQIPALAVLGVDAGGVPAYVPGTPGHPVTIDGWRVGTLICFESLFWQDARRYVRQGADVLVIQSQNGWWGRSAGHAQHLAYTRLRAVETGRPVVFASASGRSAVIAPNGQIVASLPYGKQGAAIAGVPPATDGTLFLRSGDWVSPLATVIVLGILVGQIRRRRSEIDA